MQKHSAINFFCVFWSCHYELTNHFDISIFIFSNIPGGVQLVKYYLSMISTSRNVTLKKSQNSVFQLFWLIFSLFALKTYCTMKMFLLSDKNNFSIILSSYVEEHVQKNSSLNFTSLVGFWASKIWMLFGKIGELFVELFWKLFSGRNSSLEHLVFWFSNSLPFRLDQMTLGVTTIQKCKKCSVGKFFAFLNRHYGFMKCF